MCRPVCPWPKQQFVDAGSRGSPGNIFPSFPRRVVLETDILELFLRWTSGSSFRVWQVPLQLGQQTGSVWEFGIKSSPVGVFRAWTKLECGSGWSWRRPFLGLHDQIHKIRYSFSFVLEKKESNDGFFFKKCSKRNDYMKRLHCQKKINVY